MPASVVLRPALNERDRRLFTFFDGIAALIPEYMPHSSGRDDGAIVEGLKEHGLFHVLKPEKVVEKDATAKLATMMTDVIVSGALDNLSKEKTSFASISRSRLGFGGDAGLAEMIFDELKARGLARDSEDGVSVPLHPMVRSLVLVLLSQILRPQGEKMGLDLTPATDHPSLVRALHEVLSLPSEPTAGHVVSFDLQSVGVDLASVPIDEVLAYRKENYRDYRSYTLAVKQFVRELSMMPEDEQTLKFAQRKDELEQMAAQLSGHSMRAWKKPASFAMSMTGAAIAIYTGASTLPVVGGFTRLLGAIFGGVGHGKQPPLGAYSFLFKAGDRFRY